MADPKISALNGGIELTAPAVNDLVAAVDVSDTTEAITGTTKPLRIDHLGNNGLVRIVVHDGEVITHNGEVVIY